MPDDNQVSGWPFLRQYIKRRYTKIQSTWLDSVTRKTNSLLYDHHDHPPNARFWNLVNGHNGAFVEY